jgi:hypothetical protein
MGKTRRRNNEPSALNLRRDVGKGTQAQAVESVCCGTGWSDPGNPAESTFLHKVTPVGFATSAHAKCAFISSFKEAA